MKLAINAAIYREIMAVWDARQIDLLTYHV